MKTRELERIENPKAGADCEERARRERDDARHPVDRVYGILGKPGSTDEYLAEIRGR